jgi:hypothetical protein
VEDHSSEKVPAGQGLQEADCMPFTSEKDPAWHGKHVVLAGSEE